MPTREEFNGHLSRLITGNNPTGLAKFIAKAKTAKLSDGTDAWDAAKFPSEFVSLAVQNSSVSLRVFRDNGISLEGGEGREAALIDAITYGKLESISVLLSLNVNINTRSLAGVSAFDLALASAEASSEKIAYTLLQRGAAPTSEDYASLNHALSSNKVKVAAELIKRTPGVFNPHGADHILDNVVEKLFTEGVGFPADSVRDLFMRFLTSISASSTFYTDSKNIADSGVAYTAIKKEMEGQARDAFNARIAGARLNTVVDTKLQSIEFEHFKSVFENGGGNFSIFTFAAIFGNVPAFDFGSADPSYLTYVDMYGKTPTEWAAALKDQGVLEALAAAGVAEAAEVLADADDEFFAEEVIVADTSAETAEGGAYAAAASDPAPAPVWVDSSAVSESKGDDTPVDPAPVAIVVSEEEGGDDADDFFAEAPAPAPAPEAAAEAKEEDEASDHEEVAVQVAPAPAIGYGTMGDAVPAGTGEGLDAPLLGCEQHTVPEVDTSCCGCCPNPFNLWS